MTNGARESLRRVVYGPDATAEERVAAEAVEGDFDDENGPQFFWSHSIRVAWVIPLVVGSLAVGFFATAGSWESIRDSVKPTSGASIAPIAEPTGVPSSSPRLGDLAAADSWFDRPFTATDIFPNTEVLQYYEINPENVRIAVNGKDKRSVWVGRGDSTLCLIVVDLVEGASASSCMERDNFAESGIALSSMGLQTSWYGREVTTTPYLEPISTGPLPPTSGPGDLAAANAWFAAPALPSDEYPEPSFHSIDDADSSSGTACMTSEGFQTVGLTMPTQGYSFFGTARPCP